MFTCTGTEVSIILEWQLNNCSVISEYRYNFSHTFPRSVPLMPGAPAVVVPITNVNVTIGSPSVNIVCVSDVSILNGSSLHRQDDVCLRVTEKILL